MLNSHSSVLLLKSETVQVTKVLPTVKPVPEEWLQTALGCLSTLSMISTEKCTTAAFEPASVVLVVLVGHVGASVSD